MNRGSESVSIGFFFFRFRVPHVREPLARFPNSGSLSRLVILMSMLVTLKVKQRTFVHSIIWIIETATNETTLRFS